MLINPPLSLYIHIPWCVEKCPYCDFNSHKLQNKIPEQEYIHALINDLDSDIARFNLTNRPLVSIFIGGGTPSLFSPKAMSKLLNLVLQRFDYNENIEITLEANPGTVEADKFVGFFNAGVSRLSIGIQSFESDKLIKLGRIHDGQQAKKAVLLAQDSGVHSFNLDLMHGLPNQKIDDALADLKTAIALKPTHISWYQLTIEPNTPFYAKPPRLPSDDILWDIQQQGAQILAQSGYQQYEISAYSQQGYQCQHNLNYWQFGDYLGIGCGAHGKITNASTNEIFRTVKVKQPKHYLESNKSPLVQVNNISASERPFEYMMNRLRLSSSFTLDDYEMKTGSAKTNIMTLLLQAQEQSLMQQQHENWQVTNKGHRFLNHLLEMFL